MRSGGGGGRVERLTTGGGGVRHPRSLHPSALSGLGAYRDVLSPPLIPVPWPPHTGISFSKLSQGLRPKQNLQLFTCAKQGKKRTKKMTKPLPPSPPAPTLLQIYYQMAHIKSTEPAVCTLTGKKTDREYLILDIRFLRCLSG